MCIFSEIDAILMKCSAAWTPLEGHSEKTFERLPVAGFHQHLVIFSKSETHRHCRWQFRLGVHYSTFCQCTNKLGNDDVWKLLEGEMHGIVYGVAEGYIAEQEGADYVAEREKKGKTLKEVALI